MGAVTTPDSNRHRSHFVLVVIKVQLLRSNFDHRPHPFPFRCVMSYPPPSLSFSPLPCIFHNRNFSPILVLRPSGLRPPISISDFHPSLLHPFLRRSFMAGQTCLYPAKSKWPNAIGFRTHFCLGKPNCSCIFLIKIHQG